MNLSTTFTLKPKAAPDLTLTIRRLSVIERATRNAAVPMWAEYRDKIVEQTRLASEGGDLGTIALDVEQIEQQHIRPAIIRGGVVGVQGLTLDGKGFETTPQAVDAIIKHGTDDLVSEVFVACLRASEMTAEQEKNSQSPGTSQEAGQPGNENTPA